MKHIRNNFETAECRAASARYFEAQAKKLADKGKKKPLTLEDSAKLAELRASAKIFRDEQHRILFRAGIVGKNYLDLK